MASIVRNPAPRIESMLMSLALLLQVAPPRPALAPDQGAAPIYGYIPIVIFFLVAVLVPVALLSLSRLVQRRVFDRDKLMPYECGIDPIGDARERFSVRFYMVAMLFLIFDVETVFLFPWA